MLAEFGIWHKTLQRSTLHLLKLSCKWEGLKIKYKNQKWGVWKLQIDTLTAEKPQSASYYLMLSVSKIFVINTYWWFRPLQWSSALFIPSCDQNELQTLALWLPCSRIPIRSPLLLSPVSVYKLQACTSSWIHTQPPHPSLFSALWFWEKDVLVTGTGCKVMRGRWMGM